MALAMAIALARALARATDDNQRTRFTQTTIYITLPPGWVNPRPKRREDQPKIPCRLCAIAPITYLFPARLGQPKTNQDGKTTQAQDSP